MNNGANIIRRAAGLVACGLLLCVAPPVRAQEAQGAGATREPAAVTAFDRFGNIPWEDLMARLDNFVNEVQSKPHLHGYIVGYGGRTDLPRATQRWLDVYINYLINSRGLAQSRVSAINGGLKEQDRAEFELWVAPEGAPAPEPQPTLTDEARRQFRGKLYEYEADETWSTGCEDGPCIDTTYSNFAGWLEEAPDLRGYVVVYTGKDSVPGAWRRIGEHQQQAVLEGSKLDATRVTLINGGAAEKTRIELWVVARDAPPPVAAAQSEPVLTATILCNELTSFELAEAEHADWARKRLVDALRAQPTARVYLIVHPAAPATPKEGDTNDEPAAAVTAPEANSATDEQAAAPTAPAMADLTPVDPQEAAQEWRRELSQKLGISEWRIEVLLGRADQWSDGTLAVWLVPEGALPPDPFAPDPDEQANDEPVAAEKAQAPPPVRR